MNREDFHLLDFLQETYLFTKIIDLKFQQRKIIDKIDKLIDLREEMDDLDLREDAEYEEIQFKIKKLTKKVKKIEHNIRKSEELYFAYDKISKPIRL